MQDKDTYADLNSASQLYTVVDTDTEAVQLSSIIPSISTMENKIDRVMPNSHLKTFHCLDCSLELPSRHALNQHKISCKKQFSQKVYSCYACGSTFYSPRELTDHKREVHLGIKQVRGKEAELAMAEVGANRRGRGRRLEHAPHAVMITMPPGTHILSEPESEAVLQAVEATSAGWGEASSSQGADILSSIAIQQGQKRKADEQVLLVVKPDNNGLTIVDDQDLKLADYEIQKEENESFSKKARHSEVIDVVDVDEDEEDDEDDDDANDQLILVPQVDGPADAPRRNMRRTRNAKDTTEVKMEGEEERPKTPARMVTRRAPKAKERYSPTPILKKVAGSKSPSKPAAEKAPPKLTREQGVGKGSPSKASPKNKLKVVVPSASSPAQRLLARMQGGAETAEPDERSEEVIVKAPIKTYSTIRAPPVLAQRPAPAPVARPSGSTSLPMTCCDCLAQFPSRRDMSIHKSHACPARKTSQYPYKCACRLAFQTIDALASHGAECKFVPNHTSNSRSEKGRAKEYLTCLDCGELFHRVQLANHKRGCKEDCKKPKFPCDYCSHFRALTRTQLNEHIKAYHPEATGQLPVEKRLQEIRSKMKSKTMTCFDCGQMIPSEKFQMHKWNECQAKGSKVFTCFHCHEMFSTRRELGEHKKEMHLKSGTAYMCGQCQATFDVYIDLYQHYHDVHGAQIHVAEDKIEKSVANINKGGGIKVRSPTKHVAVKSVPKTPPKAVKKRMLGADGKPLPVPSFDVAARTGGPSLAKPGPSAAKVAKMNKKIIVQEIEEEEEEYDEEEEVEVDVEEDEEEEDDGENEDFIPRQVTPFKSIKKTLVPSPESQVTQKVTASTSSEEGLPSSPSSSPGKMRLQKVALKPNKQGFVSLPNVPGVRMLVPVGNNEMLCVQCQVTLKSVTDISTHTCRPTGYKVMVKAQARSEDAAKSPSNNTDGGEEAMGLDDDGEELVVNKRNSSETNTY